MPKKTEKSPTHPDDFMVVTIGLAFNAKVNPKSDEPPRLGTTEVEISLPAPQAVDYLEQVLSAIRGRYLYGLMLTESAGSLIETKDWLPKPLEEVVADSRAHGSGDLRKPRWPGLSMVRRDA